MGSRAITMGTWQRPGLQGCGLLGLAGLFRLAGLLRQLGLAGLVGHGVGW